MKRENRRKLPIEAAKQWSLSTTDHSLWIIKFKNKQIVKAGVLLFEESQVKMKDKMHRKKTDHTFFSIFEAEVLASQNIMKKTKEFFRNMIPILQHNFKSRVYKLCKFLGARKMAKHLRALSLFQRTQVQYLHCGSQPSMNPGSRTLCTPLTSLGSRYSCGRHTYMHM